MKSIKAKKRVIQILTLGLFMGAVGCATHNMALRDARTNYDNAANDPNIVRDAPVGLHDAKLALDKADAVSKSGGSQTEVNHLAYIVNRKVETAKATALQQQQQAQLGKAGETRDAVIIAARGREIEATKQQAADNLAKSEVAENRASQAESATRETQTELDKSTERETNLANELAGLKAKETEVGTQLTLRDMMFETGKSELTSGGDRDVEKIAGIAMQNPKRAILIEGHTDSVGSAAYNKDLSKRRAQAVEDLLVQSGVAADRISIRGYGKNFPVASNKTSDGRQLNRRVVVTILHEGKAAESVH